jgi:hypothetical protein
LGPFAPIFRNPHILTVAGNYWRRAIDETRFPTRSALYATEEGTRVLVEENRPAGRVRGEVLLMHGLEGSSRSGYMVSMAQRLAGLGLAVHRMNMRSCGGSEHLTPTLYHSGLTADMLAVLRRFRAEGRGPLFVTGYSLGGNVVLKLAGELGEQARGLIAGVCAISTPIDLRACVEAIGKPVNRLYERRFVKKLCQRYQRKHAADGASFPLDGLERVRTIYEFDDRCTAPAFGFGDAANYYRTQSAIRFLPAIRVPTLLVQAQDDPMIPFGIFEGPEVRSNPHLRLLAPEHGGHLGFLSRKRPRFWADEVVGEWILNRMQEAEGEQSGPVSRLEDR